MNFHIIQATGFLNKHIKHYCFMESGVSERDVVERVIPTESIQLMFHYRNPFLVVSEEEKHVIQPRSFISGLSSSYSDVSTNGRTGVVFINFHVTGACNFFRFPLSRIEDLSVDLSDIYNREIEEVEERLCLEGTIAGKVSIIENFLLRHFSPIPQYDSLIIKKGIEMIRESKGQTNAASLSDLLSLSPKTLERKFSQYLGKTTKQIINLIRFQEVLMDFSRYKDITHTERAYRNGYFDQSHFIRDFKRFSGYTPGEFSTRYPAYNNNGEYCQV